jgi:dihydrolipoamide dehydrogenase
MKTEQADLLIIGSGQGAVPLAVDCAADGQRVVVFERDRLGGSCINWGCTPSKAFLGAAHAAGRARLAGPLGVDCDVHVDFDRLMGRVRAVRKRFNDGVAQRLDAGSIETVTAEAAFDADGGVRAGGRRFRAPVTVIDTGSRPLLPPVAGLDGCPYLTDRSVWELETLPRQLVVLGGGYVGLELGQGFARLGSTVRILERGERILAAESADIGAVLHDALQRDGVIIHDRAELTGVGYAQGRYRLQTNQGTHEADALLLAAGRIPNTAALNTEAVGIECDEQGYIRVDAQFRAGEGVYAIGEAAGQPAFTHVAWEDYRRLKDILDGGERRRDDRVLGYAVFTDPQVGRAGLSRDQARAAGYDVKIAEMPVAHMARGIEWGQELGFYRLVIDTDSDRLLGAELVGDEAGEIVHVLLDLVEAGVTAAELGRWQHIHPTYAESLPGLARRAGD